MICEYGYDGLFGEPGIKAIVARPENVIRLPPSNIRANSYPPWRRLPWLEDTRSDKGGAVQASGSYLPSVRSTQLVVVIAKEKENRAVAFTVPVIHKALGRRDSF